MDIQKPINLVDLTSPARRSWWPIFCLFMLGIIMFLVNYKIAKYGNDFLTIEEWPEYLKNTKHDPYKVEIDNKQNLRWKVKNLRSTATDLYREAKRLKQPATTFTQVAKAKNDRLSRPKHQSSNPQAASTAKSLRNQATQLEEKAQGYEKQAQAIENQLSAGFELRNLRSTSTYFRQKAEKLEKQGVKSTQDTKALRDKAYLFRAWAQNQEKQAQAIEIQLAAKAKVRLQRDARLIVWANAIAIDTILVTVALIVGFLALLLLIFKAQSRSKRQFLIFIFLLSCIVMLCSYYSFGPIWKANKGTASLLLQSYLNSPDFFNDYQESTDGTRVLEEIRKNNALHVAGAWLYVMVASAILSFPRLCSNPETRRGIASIQNDDLAMQVLEEEAWEFANAMRLMRLMLYLLALVLVVYMLTVRVQFQWLLSFIDPGQKEFSESVKGLTASGMTMRSIQSTVLIAAIYLPPTCILRLLAWELANRALPNKPLKKQSDWLVARDLNYTTNLERLTPVVAMLAPIITGPLAELIQSLLK